MFETSGPSNCHAGLPAQPGLNVGDTAAGRNASTTAIARFAPVPGIAGKNRPARRMWKSGATATPVAAIVQNVAARPAVLIAPANGEIDTVR
jgi:hypothetical protein